MAILQSEKIVTVKLGSNVLALENGLPNISLMANIVQQIAFLHRNNTKVVLVSSGAVATGRSVIKTDKKMDTVTERQLLSSVGQVKLIQQYTDLFRHEGILCSQVLVTKWDFKERHHYVNMKNCLQALLENNIIPIVNENDVVSVTELMFTDNDELAGLVSTMLDVSALYILTNVDGLYDGDPTDGNANLISEFNARKHNVDDLFSSTKSNFGRGGIITKCHTAQKVAKMGIPVTIANGLTENIIIELEKGNKFGTFFPPHKTTSSVKKWIAHSQSHAKGEVIINEGAKNSLFSPHATSLLPIGIVKLSGNFQKGDIIKILDQKGKEIGLGLTKYGRKKAASLIGQKNQKPLVHYDHLHLH
jgi:glutamate 5-kinase